MNILKMNEGRNGQIVNIWVETPGKSQLTSGTINGVTSLWCNMAGDVEITFNGYESSEDRTYSDGDMVSFYPGPVSVHITSGTFSFMVM